jgi:hypothetical protein
MLKMRLPAAVLPAMREIAGFSYNFLLQSVKLNCENRKYSEGVNDLPDVGSIISRSN